MKTENFLLKDYELKVQYLTNHFSRMWTRFNFLLTINSAFLAFYVNTDAPAVAPPFVIITGIILSGLWYCFGATDNYLVEVYRKQVGYAYELLKETALTEEGGLTELEKRVQEKRAQSKGVVLEGGVTEIYSYTGDVKKEFFNPDFDPEDSKNKIVKTIPRGFSQWRYKLISATELAVVLPILFLLLWVALGVLY